MKRSKNFVSVLLIACLVLVGIGYAYIQSTLSINGTATVDSASWDIHFENVNVLDGSVEAIEAPTVDTKKTSLTYNVKLSKPGDFYEFTVDVVNSGNIDGMIDSISSKYNENVIGENMLPTYLRYSATYSSGKELAKNQLLKLGTTEELKVRIEFRDDITAVDLPKTTQTLNLTFELTYRQANQDVIEVVHPVKYSYVVGGNWMSIGQTIPSGVNLRSTVEEAMLDWESKLGEGNTKPFYLKHKLNDEEKIEESYVEFIVTEEMASANAGMTPGTYALKGGVYEEFLEEKPIYEANKEVLYSAFGSETNYCADNSSHLLCHVSNLSVIVYDYGTVIAHDDDNHNCSVNNYGQSICIYLIPPQDDDADLNFGL